MPQPAEVQRLAEEAIRLFEDAQASLDAQLADLSTEARFDRRRRKLVEMRRSIDAEMQRLQRDVARWVTDELPRIYELGATDAAGSIGERFSWSQVHVQAVQGLADDLFADVLQATTFVTDDVKAFVREQGRGATRRAVLQGDTAQKAGRDLAKELEERGVGRITYSNGARHTVKDYADTLLRTRTAELYNQGTLNTLEQFDVAYCEVLDGTSCGWTSHDDGDKANGTVRSIEECRQHTLSHPRCRRSFHGRPNIKTADQAGKAKPSTTAEQRRNQFAAEKAREQGNQARAATKRRRQARQNRKPRPSTARKRAPRKPRSTSRTSRTAVRSDLSTMPGKFPVADRISFQSDQARQELGPIMDDVAKLHSADNATTSIGMDVLKPGNGGWYMPSTRDIMISTRDSDQALSMLHEYGHHIDLQGAGPEGSRFAAASRRVGRRYGYPPAITDDAFVQLIGEDPEMAFLTMVRGSDAYRQNGLASKKSAQYLRSPHEVWARAYAQWAAPKISDPGALLTARTWSEPRFAGMQWSDEEFQLISPFVEGCLRQWGLM